MPAVPQSHTSTLAPLAHYQGFVVKQRFEALELAGIETANAYDVFGFDGQRVLYAQERTQGFWDQFGRQMGGHTLHAFTVDVRDNQGRIILTLFHPAAWLLQRIEVRTGRGRLVGTLEQCSTWFDKQLLVKRANGTCCMQMDSHVLTPWDHTFTRPAAHGGRRVAHVQKHWDGIGRQLFSDADTLRLLYESRSLDTDERALLLAATLFIDLVWFERRAH